MIGKILIILKSRFKKNDSNINFVKHRRNVCELCLHNTLNNGVKLSFKKRVLKELSDFYSYITANKDEDSLGNCSACDSCSIFYKTAEEEENCPKNKWIK